MDPEPISLPAGYVQWHIDALSKRPGCKEWADALSEQVLESLQGGFDPVLIHADCWQAVLAEVRRDTRPFWWEPDRMKLRRGE